MPFNILDVRIDGKLIEFLYVSDHKTFQSFRLQDEEAVFRFRQSWDQLKSIAR
jgi:hypothetical protein